MEKEIKQEKVNVKKSESSDKVEKKAVPKKAPKEAPKKIKPYVHIDTFLQTAVPLYGLNNMQAQGFKNRMNGRHYQRDEQIFVDELKKYLKLK